MHYCICRIHKGLCRLHTEYGKHTELIQIDFAMHSISLPLYFVTSYLNFTAKMFMPVQMLMQALSLQARLCLGEQWKREQWSSPMTSQV
jgi:hypothetical protein